MSVAAPWNTVDQVMHTKDLWHEKGLDYKNLRDQGFPVNELDMRLLFPVDATKKSRKSVLMVQINFIKGGIIMVLSLNHGFTDGNGTAAIAKVWAACCRGEDPSRFITQEIIDRQRLIHGWESTSPTDIRSVMASQTKKRVSFSEILNRIRTSISDLLIGCWPRSTSTKKSEMDLLSQSRCAVFFFSKSRLAALKAVASFKECGEDDEVWISTNDALTALLDTCIHSSFDDRVNSMSTTAASLATAVNVRRILDPPLPADYIGNALTFIQIKAPLNSIRSTPERVAEIAHLIRKQIRELDERSIRQTITWLRKSTKAIQPAPAEDPVRVSSWATQRFYDLDWGNKIGTRIERVRRKMPEPYSGFGANCIILPELVSPHFGAEECGLEVALMDFGSERIERLKQNQLFMQFAEWRCS